MAMIINEQKMIEDNTFEYEDRIKAPTSRLLEQTPTFVTYYHIDNIETTTDAGYADVASIIGFRSPIRFNKIENMPLYGLEQIVIQLQDQDDGIDGSYEGEAIIVPNTVEPLSNDYFIIPILQDSYLFRVTEIHYDTIMANNFYKISFMLEFIDDDKIAELNKQVINNYTCILQNIGTDQRCIVEKDFFEKQEKVMTYYRNICDFYISMFYNERHNSFLCPLDEFSRTYLFDPLQVEFINGNNLLNDKNNLQVILLTDQYNDPKRKYKYNKSIYKYIETRDKRLLSQFSYRTRPAMTVKESSFARWYDKGVSMVDIPTKEREGDPCILSLDFVKHIQMGIPCDNDVSEFIRRYLCEDTLKITDIPNSIDEEVMYFNSTLEVYFFIPITLYIIKKILNDALKN